MPARQRRAFQRHAEPQDGGVHRHLRAVEAQREALRERVSEWAANQSVHCTTLTVLWISGVCSSCSTRSQPVRCG